MVELKDESDPYMVKLNFSESRDAECRSTLGKVGRATGAIREWNASADVRDRRRNRFRSLYYSQ
jgi:hypothetical protein